MHILAGLSALEKTYLMDLAKLCQEAAGTDNPAVLEATIRQFESVPGQLRRIRAERAQLSRSGPVPIRPNAGSLLARGL